MSRHCTKWHKVEVWRRERVGHEHMFTCSKAAGVSLQQDVSPFVLSPPVSPFPFLLSLYCAHPFTPLSHQPCQQYLTSDSPSEQSLHCFHVSASEQEVILSLYLIFYSVFLLNEWWLFLYLCNSMNVWYINKLQPQMSQSHRVLFGLDENSLLGVKETQKS